jgi:hypothetical protein
MATFSVAVEEVDYPVEDEPLVYRGDKSDLPTFLPGFVIPVPSAWFDALFIERREKKRKIYTSEAYAVGTGYIVYDRREAYEANFWAEAMKTIKFAVQVDWAQTTAVATNAEHGLMEVSVFKPDAEQKALKRQHTLTTTQARFLAFLKSGRGNLKLCGNESPAAYPLR